MSVVLVFSCTLSTIQVPTRLSTSRTPLDIPSPLVFPTFSSLEARSLLSLFQSVMDSDKLFSKREPQRSDSTPTTMMRKRRMTSDLSRCLHRPFTYAFTQSLSLTRSAPCELPGPIHTAAQTIWRDWLNGRILHQPLLDCYVLSFCKSAKHIPFQLHFISIKSHTTLTLTIYIST